MNSVKNKTSSGTQLTELQEQAWRIHCRQVTFYLPGMFTINGKRGKYPALSITGKHCDLLCGHCYGKLLQQMIDCSTPERLLHKCLQLSEQGYPGCLITGGCSKDGKLPFKKIFPVMQEIKRRTSLKISVHAGVVNEELVRGLAEVGISRVLIDVVGSAQTLKDIYKLNIGIDQIEKSLELLSQHNLHFVPHVVIGIDRGHIIGEYEALRLIRRYNPPQLNLVVFMPLPDTPLFNCSHPDLAEVENVMRYARELFIDIPIALGCGRPRGEYSVALEKFAIDIGINRIALWNDETIDYARKLDIHIEFKDTCCSI